MLHKQLTLILGNKASAISAIA